MNLTVKQKHLAGTSVVHTVFTLYETIYIYTDTNLAQLHICTYKHILFSQEKNKSVMDRDSLQASAGIRLGNIKSMPCNTN